MVRGAKGFEGGDACLMVVAPDKRVRARFESKGVLGVCVVRASMHGIGVVAWDTPWC